MAAVFRSTSSSRAARTRRLFRSSCACATAGTTRRARRPSACLTCRASVTEASRACWTSGCATGCAWGNGEGRGGAGGDLPKRAA
eukprot:366093-Chlamydomonas_euryale.AAC.12